MNQPEPNDRARQDEQRTMLRRALSEAAPGVTKFNPLSRITAHDDFNSGTHGWVQLSGNYDAEGNLDSMEPQMSDFRPPLFGAFSLHLG